MINIKNMSRDFTEVEQYLMTISPAIVSMKDVEDGTSITVAGILNFEDIISVSIDFRLRLRFFGK